MLIKSKILDKKDEVWNIYGSAHGRICYDHDEHGSPIRTVTNLDLAFITIEKGSGGVLEKMRIPDLESLKKSDLFSQDAVEGLINYVEEEIIQEGEGAL